MKCTECKEDIEGSYYELDNDKEKTVCAKCYEVSQNLYFSQPNIKFQDFKEPIMVSSRRQSNIGNNANGSKYVIISFTQKSRIIVQ